MSRRLLLIFASIAALLGYFFFMEDVRQAGIPMGIFATLVIITWTLQHQIDWVWTKKRPPRLPSAIDRLYTQHFAFYAGLSGEDKIEFGKRVGLFIVAKEFIGMGKSDVPDDVKYMIAAYAIALSWNQADYLMTGYDRVVFYPHPFLTPHYGEQVHTYEVENIDGTMILAIDQMVGGFLSPGTYYQTGWHTCAEVFAALFMTGDQMMNDDTWEVLEKISKVPKAKIEEHTGMAQHEPWPVAVHHYYSYPRAFQEVAPELYAQITRVLGYSNPVEK